MGRCLWNQSLVIKQRREMLFSCLGMNIKVNKYSLEKNCREKKVLCRVREKSDKEDEDKERKMQSTCK